MGTDRAGGDSTPRAGDGVPALSTARLRGVLDGTYARVFGCAASTDAAIRDALSRAQTAGGGIVQLPNASVTLTSPLPLVNGVYYVGTEPTITEINTTNGVWLADGEWNYTSGTILTGDGTFAAFEANATDQGSLPTGVGTTVITNAGVIGVGLDNFTYGIHAGAQNIMGLVYSTIERIYVKRCSQWAVKLVNFAHCKFDRILDALCQNGQYYGAQMPGTTFLPGNTQVGELYHLFPRDGRDNRLCRGVVFEAAGTGAGLNEMMVRRVQSNGFGRALLSDTATFASGSTSVTVADGSKYAVGMPVNFTATGQGFTASQMYFVLSVSGTTLTIGATRTGSAVSATGTGTLTLQTYGFPNVELSSQNTGAKVANSRFDQIDAEGLATCGVYVENASGTLVGISEVPGTALVHLVVRGSQFCEFRTMNVASTDIDAGSTGGSAFFGNRGASLQRPLKGLWLDNVLGVNCFQIANGTAGQTGGDIHNRVAGFLYPAAGMGERIFTRDSAITLGGGNVGDIVFNGGTGVTFTLPTIVTDSSLAASHVGAWFEIYNVSANSLTVATDGTQLFNKVAAKTSLTVATQTSLKVIACKDNSGNLFWAAKASALA